MIVDLKIHVFNVNPKEKSLNISKKKIFRLTIILKQFLSYLLSKKN